VLPPTTPTLPGAAARAPAMRIVKGVTNYFRKERGNGQIIYKINNGIRVNGD
jgi:hypothetical protein